MSKIHSYRGRLNAFLLSLLEQRMHQAYGNRKRDIFQSLPRKFVEIGPGTGANLRYYQKGTSLIAIEPNPMMHGYLLQKARRQSISIDLRLLEGEQLDMDCESVDAVVGTLVLCSVVNQKAVISEIKRVLKPGGRFLFLEHIAAPEGTLLNRMQKMLVKPWRWLFDGCHLNRGTHSILLNSQFSKVEMDCFVMRPNYFPFAPHIFGVAFK